MKQWHCLEKEIVHVRAALLNKYLGTHDLHVMQIPQIFLSPSSSTHWPQAAMSPPGSKYHFWGDIRPEDLILV